MKRYIGVYHEEKEFVANFIEYMNRYYYKDCITVGFVREDEIMEFGKKEQIDVLFVSEEASEESHIGNQNIILSASREEGRPNHLFLYQSVKGYLEYLTMIQQREENQITKPHTSDVMVAAVYSPVGGVGKTQYAMDITRKKDGLYIGMEEFSDFIYEDTAEEILYEVKQRNLEVGAHIREKVRRTQDIRVFSCGNVPLDIRELDKEDMAFLITVLKDMYPKTKLVFDIDAGILSSYDILDEFDKVYVPCHNKEQGKICNFQRLLQRMECESILDKMIYLEDRREENDI